MKREYLTAEAFNSKNGWNLLERSIALAIGPVLDVSNVIGDGLKKMGMDLSDVECDPRDIMISP